MSIHKRTIKEELRARTYTIDVYLQEVVEKEQSLEVCKDKLNTIEQKLERNFIESSRVMLIADKYLPLWDSLLAYHQSDLLSRIFFSRNTKIAYKEVCKRMHYSGIPDIKITLQKYLKTYSEVKTAKRQLESVRYRFDLSVECYSDFIDTL